MKTDKTFWTIVTVLIFATTITIIMGFVMMMIGWAQQDYCTHTQIMKLQDSGDYYSCLRGQDTKANLLKILGGEK